MSYMNTSLETNLISVIIPVYNSEKYLVKCLDSVINQSYKYYENKYLEYLKTKKLFYVTQTDKHKIICFLGLKIKYKL